MFGEVNAFEFTFECVDEYLCFELWALFMLFHG